VLDDDQHVDGPGREVEHCEQFCEQPVNNFIPIVLGIGLKSASQSIGYKSSEGRLLYRRWRIHRLAAFPRQNEYENDSLDFQRN